MSKNTGELFSQLISAPQETSISQHGSQSHHTSYGLGRVSGFVVKAFEMFSDERHRELCGWGRDGKTVLILKISAFEEVVLPMYFKHSKYTSFVRQLNMYAFHKTVANPHIAEFHHQFFQRGRADLLHLIKRKARSSNKAAEDEDEDASLRMSSLAHASGTGGASGPPLGSLTPARAPTQRMFSHLEATSSAASSSSSPLRSTEHLNPPRHHQSPFAVPFLGGSCSGAVGGFTNGNGSNNNNNSSHDPPFISGSCEDSSPRAPVPPDDASQSFYDAFGNSNSNSMQWDSFVAAATTGCPSSSEVGSPHTGFSGSLSLSQWALPPSGMVQQQQQQQQQHWHHRHTQQQQQQQERFQQQKEQRRQQLQPSERSVSSTISPSQEQLLQSRVSTLEYTCESLKRQAQQLSSQLTLCLQSQADASSRFDSLVALVRQATKKSPSSSSSPSSTTTTSSSSSASSIPSTTSPSYSGDDSAAHAAVSAVLAAATCQQSELQQREEVEEYGQPGFSSLSNLASVGAAALKHQQAGRPEGQWAPHPVSCTATNNNPTNSSSYSETPREDSQRNDTGDGPTSTNGLETSNSGNGPTSSTDTGDGTTSTGSLETTNSDDGDLKRRRLSPVSTPLGSHSPIHLQADSSVTPAAR